MTDSEQRAVIERANHFYNLAEAVGEWALETFGGPERVVPCAIHMRREAQEAWHAAMNLEAALLIRADEQTVQARKADVADECADLVILAMAMSAHAGFDLEAAFRKKMLENLDRQWSPPDHEGVITHRKAAV